MQKYLSKIKESDLLFENIPMEDRITTDLKLHDYDWMTYVLSAIIKTKNQGKLKVNVRYCGITQSDMEVKQVLEGVETLYLYEFSSDLFETYLVKFMKAHMAQWDEKYAFYGGDIVLEFYNEVIGNNTEHGVVKNFYE